MASAHTAVLSILVVSTTTNLAIPIAPSLLGALVDYQGFSNEAAGRLISLNFWGATAATVFGLFIVHPLRWDLRLTMLGCLLLVMLSAAPSVWMTDNITAVAAARFANGVGAGLAFTVGAIALVGTPQAERSYAILYGLPFLISGAGLAALPLVYRNVGIEGAFLGMAALNLLACALLRYFPRRPRPQPAHSQSAPDAGEKSFLFLPGLLLTALTLHYVFNSGIWTYFERLGVAYGHSAETAGAVLGPAMSAAIFGMAAAALLGDRFRHVPPILAGTLLIAISSLALLLSGEILVFAVATALFNASITFVTPYFVALLASLVPSGTGVAAANVATLAGFSTGPLLVSLLISGNSFRGSILLTTAGFLAVCGIVLAFSKAVRGSGLAQARLSGAPSATSDP